MFSDTANVSDDDASDNLGGTQRLGSVCVATATVLHLNCIHVFILFIFSIFSFYVIFSCFAEPYQFQQKC